MDIDDHPGVARTGGQALAVAPVEHRLRNPVDREIGRHLRRGIAEDQERPLDPGPADLERLLQVGDREKAAPGLVQLAGYMHGPVAIGIRLDHADDLRGGRHPLPDGLIILLQRVEIHLDPRAL